MTRRRAALMGALVLLAAIPAVAGPVIAVEERAHVAGAVEQGAKISHVFTVKNEGDETLSILAVRPACGCTVANDYTREIAPGQSGTIPIILDTTKFRGQISKTVTVTSNATNESRTVLQVKAEVLVPLEILPNPRLYLNTVQGRTAERELLLRPQREGLEVTSVTSDNPHLSVALVPVEASTADARPGSLAARLSPREGDQWLKVTLAKGAPVGILNARVKVATTDPKVGTVEVAVRANVKEKPAAAAGAN